MRNGAHTSKSSSLAASVSSPDAGSALTSGVGAGGGVGFLSALGGVVVRSTQSSAGSRLRAPRWRGRIRRRSGLAATGRAAVTPGSCFAAVQRARAEAAVGGTAPGSNFTGARRSRLGSGAAAAGEGAAAATAAAAAPGSRLPGARRSRLGGAAAATGAATPGSRFATERRSTWTGCTAAAGQGGAAAAAAAAFRVCRRLEVGRRRPATGACAAAGACAACAAAAARVREYCSGRGAGRRATGVGSGSRRPCSGGVVCGCGDDSIV